MSKDWRIETSAKDFLGNQQKRLATEERRPTIRKASDLVGPGIDAAAVPITDFNDQLASFNGYFSAQPGALYAPNSTDAFIGFVIMDATLGGQQKFTSLVSGNEYTRVFLRNPSDEASVSYGAWLTQDTVPAMAFSPTPNSLLSQGVTGLEVDESKRCQLPQLEFTGQPGTYGRSNTILFILRPGIYSGYYLLRTDENQFFTFLKTEFPHGDTMTDDTMYNVPSGGGAMIPLNFRATGTNGYFSVIAVLGGDDPVATARFNRLHVTRLGDP